MTFEKGCSVEAFGFILAVASAASPQEKVVVEYHRSSKSTKRLARRRRKIPLALIQYNDGGGAEKKPSYKKNSETSLALGIHMDALPQKVQPQNPTNNVGKAIKDKDASVIFIVQSENYDTIDQDIKPPPPPPSSIVSTTSLEDYIINSDKNDNDKQDKTREYPVIQKVNARIRKNQLAAMDETNALIKMLRTADDSTMSMSMGFGPSKISMAPMTSPTEMTQTSGYVPVLTPTKNDGPPKRPSVSTNANSNSIVLPTESIPPFPDETTSSSVADVIEDGASTVFLASAHFFTTVIVLGCIFSCLVS
ncbi:unnamed protein product [Pseudo-nitzschia multistriata]|uniref:Uncharacterized protein n=1 Tax=Pseudo-nitzschia multistriata TaxID=183589 RepID=A0A448Z1T8_9STRA|nr:unnamed protein product [Pseudo-nitzschia multistriata]